MNVGVLALQGDFARHVAMVRRLGHDAREVRTPDELSRVDALILPGGESTTLLKLLASSGLESALREFHADGRALYGTCAGLILLATEVVGPEQPSLGLLDVTVERNAYGRQLDSFEADVALPFGGDPAPYRVVFIRAPMIRRTGPGVETVLAQDGAPILVRQGHVVGGAFHPELTDDPRVHAWFLDEVAAAR